MSEEAKMLMRVALLAARGIVERERDRTAMLEVIDELLLLLDRKRTEPEERKRLEPRS